jgi:hypothetical protein
LKIKRIERPSSAKNTGGETVLERLSDREGSLENASEARELLATMEGGLHAAELGPEANAASILRKDGPKVAAEHRPLATSFSTPDGLDPHQGILRFLTDFQKFSFEADLDHLMFADDLARRRHPLSRQELEKWWTAHRGGRVRDVNKPIELLILFSTYDGARRRIRRSAGTKRLRGRRRPGR